MLDTQSGCYKDCTNCRLTNNCCTSFNHINAPVLNKNEVERLVKILNKDNFYEKVKDNLYHIKTQNNKCIFYQNDKCIIYHNRPIDCKLYPFDIIQKENKYYLILYTLDCININDIISEMKSINELIDSVVPWIEDFSDDSNYTKMQYIKYVVLKEIKIT